MTLQPTGTQYEISHGRYRAVVTEVGATLRSITVDGQELLWTFGPDEPAQHSQGQQLLPWPNRIADGRYEFDGRTEQLPVNEFPRNTALHGLNTGRAWELVSHDADSVVQRHTLFPERGWSGVLTATITHTVGTDGLRVRVDVVNDGTTALPYGYGVHPYFEFGDLADVTLLLPFDEELDVDAERLLPRAVVPISEEFDFREARPLGEVELDTAFTSPRDASWAVELRGPDRAVQVWADETLPWVQVYTTRPERHAVAVEPMTCGPDAFNEGPTHAGMIRLEPGGSASSVWGVRAL
ncbi:aldose 1-epimerase family protein [Tessaracoccus rhinocerotis]|uniref:Aldose 1-epimerase family protein n=1 Tax=Tessaracoccus rhinocerotis TaxID=1689449 RepID=A0A553JVW6_9ACTN|nr:aldose 1-epimerase family protein [Tessaracoccus rhinocerotis]TRY16598.1 aldose 1-epimerase family protein [Tessaracoccus rhinocerotis]